MLKAMDISLKSSLVYEDKFLHIHIDKFEDLKRKIYINGDIVIDAQNTEITASLNLDINNDLLGNLLINVNQKNLFYKLISFQDVKNTKYITNLFDLPKEIHFWARDAIEHSSFSINKAYGWIDFNDIENGYKNIYAEACANGLKYTYNKKLDSIHTKKTDLKFKNGVLYINPKKAHSYGMDLAQSWLKIDFTQRDELLTLYLLFDGKLNEDMLNILNTYKIKLPFLQKEGNVKTNLKLAVNLMTLDVDAKGDFFTKKGNFDYLGLNIDISDAYIILDNYDAKANNMKISFKDIAKSDISFKYNAKKDYGDINFNISKISFKQYALELQKPFKLVYEIREDKDKMNINNSFWNIKDYKIELEKTSLGFNIEELICDVPKTLIKNEMISTYFLGSIDLKAQKAHLKLLPLNMQKNVIDLIYDKNITLSSEDKIKYIYKNIDFELESAVIDQKENTLKLNNLSAKHEKYGNIFIDKDNISLYVDIEEYKTYLNDISIYMPALLDGFSSNEDKNLSMIDNFHVEAKNSKLHLSQNRYILADKISLKIDADTLNANLDHADGKADFNYKDNNFTLNGNGFNDLFMEKLFDNSDFKGGKFDFSIKGNPQKYGGELYAKDTTILKYKLLNNTLAFINTVPSLTTFSLPSFNKDGIYVKSSYIKFNYENNKYNIHDAFLKSNELSIRGQGNVDILNNKIDMDLVLKTDLGSKLSKIPVVGYIILDKDSLSTKLKLSGDLDNPQVKTKIAKQILKAPLNILKRTLELPFSIFEKDKDK